MRVIYTFDQLLVCGGVRVPFHHCKALMTRGIDAQIGYVSAHGYGEGIADWIRYYKVPIVDISEVQNLEEGDVMVSCWYPMVEEMFDRMNIKCRKYHFIQGNDYLADVGEDRKAMLDRLFARTDYRFLAVSPWAASVVRQDVLVVPNGVDKNIFYYMRNKERSPLRILLEGRYGDTIKRMPEAFEIAQELKRRYGVEVWYLNPDEKSGISWIDREINHPFTNDIAEAYLESDILIKTTKADGWGLPHLEAMACGCAVVTTNAGGNMSFCIHEKNSLVGELHELVGLASRLIENRELRERLLREGREVARELSWARAGKILAWEFRGDNKEKPFTDSLAFQPPV